MKPTENRIYIAKFGYGKNESFTKEFEISTDKDATQVVNEYVKDQNKGEPKSDRIHLLKMHRKQD